MIDTNKMEIKNVVTQIVRKEMKEGRSLNIKVMVCLRLAELTFGKTMFLSLRWFLLNFNKFL